MPPPPQHTPGRGGSSPAGRWRRSTSRATGCGWTRAPVNKAGCCCGRRGTAPPSCALLRTVVVVGFLSHPTRGDRKHPEASHRRTGSILIRSRPTRGTGSIRKQPETPGNFWGHSARCCMPALAATSGDLKRPGGGGCLPPTSSSKRRCRLLAHARSLPGAAPAALSGGLHRCPSFLYRGFIRTLLPVSIRRPARRARRSAWRRADLFFL